MTIPEMRHCTVSVGSGGGMFSLNSSSASVRVSLVPKGERTRDTAEVVKEVKEKLSLMTGADISVSASSTMSMMLGSVDMSVMIKGSDLKTLEFIANELKDQIAELPEVTDATVDITEGNPEVQVLIDRNVASYYGISAYQLANGLSTALSGTSATKLKIGGEEIDIRLSLPETYKQSIDNMKQIMITGATGISVPVGQIADLEFNNSPSLINRIDQQRYVTLNVSIDSKNLGSAAAAIDSIVDAYPFPEGYYYDTAGMQEEMLDAFSSLFQALLIAVALVYLVLAAQFESLIQPFIVATAIPFAMSGALLALFITDTKLSLTSILGLIMLVGIVINSSILLVTFITQYRNTLGRDEAIVAAGKIRLRPILMMTFTTCAAMTPIAIGIGEGSEMLSPMGIAIIGGLIASTLVTLIFVPVLYSLIDDGTAKRLAKKELKNERLALLEAKWREEDGQHA
jgi:HAE1 family hydrophobic/amphiphilic exporter-1